MNHRRESERLDRVMALNTALQHLGIKRHQLAPDRIKLAVKHRCAVIRQEPCKSTRNRHYQQMEEARTMLLNHIAEMRARDNYLRNHGLQLQLFEFTG